MFLIQCCTSWVLSLQEKQPKSALNLYPPINRSSPSQPIPAPQPKAFDLPVKDEINVVVIKRIIAPVSGENVTTKNEAPKMNLNVTNIQTGLTSLNKIATEIETVANSIPTAFLPVKVQEALVVLKTFQTIAPAVLADVQDVVTKIETAYASLTSPV